MGAIRPQLHAITNWRPNTISFFMQTDNLSGTAAYNMSNWSYQDWKNHLTMAAFFQTYYPWLTSPYPFDNPNFKANFTNANMLPLLKDRAYRVEPVRVGATNSVFMRKSSDPNKTWVLMMNESPTATTNLFITYAEMRIPTNTVLRVMNQTSNTFLATISTNRFTFSVPPTNAVVLMFDSTRWIPDTGGNALVFSVPGLSNAMQVSLISTGQIAIGNNPSADSAFHIDHPSTAYDISWGVDGAKFKWKRNVADGMNEMFGEQAGANGLRLTGADGEYALFRPTFATLPKPTALATNTASGNTITNEIVVGAKTTARNQRFSIAVSAFGTATLANGIDASLVVSNASDGKILTQKFSIPAGVLAIYTITNELCIPDADPLSIYWLTNCSVVPGTSVITYK